MSRFVNWVLTVIAVAAGAALIVDGIHPADIFNDDATILLCIAAAVPSVVVAIRRHTARIKAVLAAEFAASRADARQALDELGDRLTKHTLETAMGVMAQMVTRTKMEAADRAANGFRLTDTGPFRMPR